MTVIREDGARGIMQKTAERYATTVKLAAKIVCIGPVTVSMIAQAAEDQHVDVADWFPALLLRV